MPCNGKSGAGCSQKCSTFEPKKSGGDNKNSKCGNCSHRKKVHTPAPALRGIEGVLAQYNLGTLNKKAPTDSEARKESSSGYRPYKQSASSGASGSVVKAKGKASKTEPSSELVKINSVQVTTCGLDVRYDVSARSSTHYARRMASFGSRRIPPLRTLSAFRLDWTQQQLDQWLRKNLRLLFKFLDLRYPGNAAPGFHWVLLGKSLRKLYVKHRPQITGAEVSEAKGPAARKYTEHAVRIGESLFGDLGSSAQLMYSDQAQDPAIHQELPRDRHQEIGGWRGAAVRL
ncbi:hypothetical protein B0H10DRAFT_2078524 [Mycena sp. CBHHK59/15]|nr:hypothetical protein B0H10DRAFT_2078524 [Mycena sp. CBHHK59/15]